MSTCEYVVNWKTAPDGESCGDEIICGKPAAFIDENGVKSCAGCAECMRREGFEVTPICSGCGNEIDPDCCHCGDAREGHGSTWEGHAFVPMGCVCGYASKGDAK